ncbi:MAG: hypothetical protein M1829_004905 [Trizodia sp. TS-e1964]|nr:MAG: hypothetical protein M1829_004905 [Trizodia sp. TS-e1964]
MSVEESGHSNPISTGKSQPSIATNKLRPSAPISAANPPMFPRSVRRAGYWLAWTGYTILFVYVISVYVAPWLLISIAQPRKSTSRFPPQSPQGLASVTEGRPDHGAKVPVEIHIMSKCPDARDCLQDLVLPAMQQVVDLVDFKLSFIGRATQHDDGVECMHGPSECLGNIIELCAAELYPDPKIYLGFAMCLSLKYQEIAERHLVEGCANEHGLDFARLNHCTSRDDGYGLSLLRNSTDRSSQLGVKKSCTIRLDNQVRCVLDGGVWKDCDGGHEVEDLVRDVRRLSGGQPSAYPSS